MCISCRCASVLSVPAALLQAYVHVSSPPISCRHRAALPSRASGASNSAVTARIGAASASGDTRADVPCARGTYFRIAAGTAGAPARDAATNAAAFAADANTADANAVADATDDTADAAHAATVYDAARAIAPPRAAFGASSEPKTVRPPIKPAVQRAVQSEPLCARGVAQPAAMPSTNSLGTLALAP